jgi:hypothetical protein
MRPVCAAAVQADRMYRNPFIIGSFDGIETREQFRGQTEQNTVNPIIVCRFNRAFGRTVTTTLTESQRELLKTNPLYGNDCFEPAA